MIRINIWIGKEKEGKYKGVKTLFVGSKKYSWEYIQKLLEKQNNIEQIYFGAGKCTPINYNTIKNCLDSIKGGLNILITIEIDLKDINKAPKYILLDEKINWIITINNKKFNTLKELEGKNVQLKIQSVETLDKCLFVADFFNFNSVDVDEIIGKTYKGDRVLE